MASSAPTEPKPRRRLVACSHRGRQLDETRDPEILRAALELLAESGYDRLTMEAVAARAKAGKATLYRRWQGKADLVLDAIESLGDRSQRFQVDTGTLRGDLRAAFVGVLGDLDEFEVGVMSGLLTALRRNPDLAAAFEERFVASTMGALRLIFARARDRGEVAAGHDLELLSTIGPAIFFHRLLLSSKPLTRHYVCRVIDEVILPLAGADRPRKAKA